MIKIIADSSSDVLSLKEVPFESVPLKIITPEKEYIDNKDLDVSQMVGELLTLNDKTKTACPSVGDWLEAFGDSEKVFCVTITSGLSGSYNSAVIAKREYEEKYPDREVFVIDSLSAGPELTLIIEKLEEFILQGKNFSDICKEVKKYQDKTGLVFMLESLKNLANNGRVNKIVAKAVGVLGIRLVGALQDDLQALHAADAPQPVVDGSVKVDAHAIRHGLPCAVVVFVGGADHTVQIKNDACVFHTCRLLMLSKSVLRRGLKW